ncbi:MAG: TetR/AcrR family transcriptional regulator [Sciscionella sp.]
MEDSEPIIWMRPEVTGRGKAPAYSREQIAKAAVTIADAEGIDAVSMRKVASAIGAGTMSLYRYVHNKDELYALMVDAVSGEDAADAGGDTDWRHGLHDIGRGTRRAVLRHPWLMTAAAAAPAMGPNTLRGMEQMMSVVDGLGLDIDEMFEIVTTVMTFATGFAQNELAQARAMLRSGMDKQQYQFRGAAYIRSLIGSGDYPYLRQIVVDAAIPHLDDDAVFERALGRIITGIAAGIDPTDLSSANAGTKCDRSETERAQPA